MLKCTQVYSSLILSKLFEQSLQTSTLPSDWKAGKVVPVHKSGDVHSPNNYRPISLTSIPVKILEHVIYSHLIEFLEPNSFFSIYQHGFRKAVSCETQLLCFTNDLFINADLEFDTDCIYLDFAKAFDSVSHELLIFKLNQLNIDPNVLAWIKEFLSNRSQYVTANNFYSSNSVVTSGVPQGSVLGPLLFLIYINDLPSCVSSSTVRLFADDCVLYHKITSHTDHLNLQRDLDSISTWCKAWFMTLNIAKCKSMRVSRHTTIHCPRTYSLNNIPLASVDNYKYLGVHISSNLSWNKHVDYVTNNANRMLGYLRRNFSSAPSSLKLTLYKTLVRPKLEYACAIWDPTHAILIQTLEAIQNRAARFILSNYSRHSSVTSMKSTLNLPDLSLRRKLSRLNLFHKIYHYNSSLKDALIHPPRFISPRIDHRFKVGLPSCRSRLCNDSFIPRTSAAWNHLPASIACITNLHDFKLAVQDAL